MIFDIVVLCAIAVSALIAFFRGFIRETLTIIGVLGGAAAAFYFAPSLSPVVRGWFGLNTEEEVGTFLGLPYTLLADGGTYLGIFLLVMIILSVCSYLLSKSVEAVGLGAIDRTFGVFFGIIRAVLLISLLYLPVYWTFDKDVRDGWFEEKSWLKESRTIVYVEYATSKLALMIPQKPEKPEGEDTPDNETSDGEKKGKAADALKALEVIGTIQGVKQKIESKAAEQNADESGAAGYDKEQIETLDQLIKEEYNQAE